MARRVPPSGGSNILERESGRSGEADAKKIAAQAEAQSIREVNKALAEAEQNPLLYQLRSLEVERSRVEHWNGQYPTYLLQTGATSPNLMLQMPAPPH